MQSCRACCECPQSVAHLTASTDGSSGQGFVFGFGLGVRVGAGVGFGCDGLGCGWFTRFAKAPGPLLPAAFSAFSIQHPATNTQLPPPSFSASFFVGVNYHQARVPLLSSPLPFNLPPLPFFVWCQSQIVTKRVALPPIPLLRGLKLLVSTHFRDRNKSIDQGTKALF